MKSNPRLLEDFGFKVFYNGQKVDYKKINWRKYNESNFNFTLIQSPGDKNFLGRIKKHFQTLFRLIYMIPHSKNCSSIKKSI
jgi:murein L,D-transpeptidase YcbB/YkuD